MEPTARMRVVFDKYGKRHYGIIKQVHWYPSVPSPHVTIVEDGGREWVLLHGEYRIIDQP